MSDCPKTGQQFRRAGLSDVPHILNLVREFYLRDGAGYGIKFHGPSAIATIGTVINRGICIIGPTSCAGALLAPFPWNHSQVIAQIPFWYFRRPREILIFKEMLGLCKAIGATHINAASLFPRNTVARHYAKFGLQPAENQHIGML